jgi:TrmH family RNA methyltransferase
MISSSSNPAIKQIRALRQRKERERSGLFFIEGIRLVIEAFQLAAPVESLIVAPELLNSPSARQLVEAQTHAERPCLEVTAEVFRSISARDGPQGLGALVRQRWETIDQVRLDTETGIGWVALDTVQDPGNLGTIVRTCDAVGGTGVILLDHTTDPYDPTALRASMGAIFAQRLVRTSFTEFADWKRRHNYPLIGASGGAEYDYQAVSYRTPLVLLMGSERQGLNAEQQALCDRVVSIPMVGRSDSLNLAVATGVMLYEVFNQQRRED